MLTKLVLSLFFCVCVCVCLMEMFFCPHLSLHSMQFDHYFLCIKLEYEQCPALFRVFCSASLTAVLYLVVKSVCGRGSFCFITVCFFSIKQCYDYWICCGHRVVCCIYTLCVLVKAIWYGLDSCSCLSLACTLVVKFESLQCLIIQLN